MDLKHKKIDRFPFPFSSDASMRLVLNTSISASKDTSHLENMRANGPVILAMYCTEKNIFTYKLGIFFLKYIFLSYNMEILATLILKKLQGTIGCRPFPRCGRVFLVLNLFGVGCVGLLSHKKKKKGCRPVRCRFVCELSYCNHFSTILLALSSL